MTAENRADDTSEYWRDPTDDLPLIDHPDHLATTWQAFLTDRAVIGPELVVLVIDPAGQVELCTIIEGVPEEPDPGDAEVLVGRLHEIAPDCSLAFLRVREPVAGDDPETAADRGWARAFGVAAQASGARVWPLHRWTGDRVRLVLPVDRGVA